MGRRRALVLIFVARAAWAGETTPVTVWSGSSPSGACKGQRISIDVTGQIYVCPSSTWSAVSGVGGGAPTTAQYWTGAADAGLSGEKNLGVLAPGLVLNTAGAPSAYGGTGVPPANQWLRQLSAAGAGTWAQLDWTDLSGKPSTFPATTPVATASALAADPTACGAGSYVSDITAAGVLTCGTPAGTYSLPDAAAGTTGGLRLTGDLGGTATSPSVVDDSHTHTTTTISGLDAGADFTAGTLPQSRGGLGVASLTCAGTDKVTCNGTVCSCAADVGGGGGSPGGSTTQVQYNNAGAFGGISGVTSDGTNLVFLGTATPPAAPASGSLKFWAARPHGASGPVMPYWIGGTTQVDYRLFPEVLSTDPVWGCLQPAATGSTTITPVGSMAAGTATGTAAAVAWAATDARTRVKWVQYPTGAAANTNAGLRANLDYVWRGNAAGLGGFYWWGSFVIVTTNSTQRVFAGLKDATAVLTAAADPNAALDTVYFGCNAADTNLSICSNDNASTATCTTLGANFPCKAANTAYDVALWAQPNGSSIGYFIQQVVSGNSATGTVSSDLPRNTVQLGWDFTMNSGANLTITTIQFGGTCYIGNP